MRGRAAAAFPAAFPAAVCTALDYFLQPPTSWLSGCGGGASRLFGRYRRGVARAERPPPPRPPLPRPPPPPRDRRATPATRSGVGGWDPPRRVCLLPAGRGVGSARPCRGGGGGGERRRREGWGGGGGCPHIAVHHLARPLYLPPSQSPISRSRIPAAGRAARGPYAAAVCYPRDLRVRGERRAAGPHIAARRPAACRTRWL